MNWHKLPLILSLVAITGCSTLTPSIQHTALPKQLPQPAHSLYGGRLDCLGNVVAQNGSQVDVLIGGLEDATLSERSMETGWLSWGGPFMARTTLAKLAPRVSVITPTAYDPRRPTVLLKGQFTEVDRVPLSRGWGWSLRLPFGFELTFDTDEQVDIITLDLELAQPDGRMLPGMATALSVPVDSKSRSGNVLVASENGSYAGGAAATDKSVARRHAAQRQLIEAGVVDLFSRYFGVNEKACANTNPHP